MVCIRASPILVSLVLCWIIWISLLSPCIIFNSDFIKEFGRFCLADPLTPYIVAVYRLVSLHCITALYDRGIASACIAALHCLVSWHCIALYCSIVLPCTVVSWHCIALYSGIVLHCIVALYHHVYIVAYHFHIILVRISVIVRFASLIA